MGEWKAIESAPYGVEVEVRAGRMTFPAMLVRDGSMTDEDRSCDQWQATTDKHPRDWCDGCCWESNSEGNMSAQPSKWRFTTRRPHRPPIPSEGIDR